jgi:glycerophosphoryl diester phosphodiesterase
MKFLATATLALVFMAGCAPERGTEPNPNFLVIGHRGAPEDEAENTLPSFQKALELGASAIETDFCVTADDQIVIWHDRDPDSEIALARQTGAEGLAYVPSVPLPGDPMRKPVDQLTLDELRDNYGYAQMLGTRDTSKYIPTLEEFYDWAGDHPELRAVYLDIKLAPGQTERAKWLFEQAVKGRMGRTGNQDLELRFINPEPDIAGALEAARLKLEPVNVRVARDFEQPGVLAGMKELDLRNASMGITPSWTWIQFSQEVSDVVEARERGEVDSVTVWTLDYSLEMNQMLDYGVDGIMTNDPGALYDAWQESLSDE